MGECRSDVVTGDRLLIVCTSVSRPSDHQTVSICLMMSHDDHKSTDICLENFQFRKILECLKFKGREKAVSMLRET